MIRYYIGATCIYCLFCGHVNHTKYMYIIPLRIFYVVLHLYSFCRTRIGRSIQYLVVLHMLAYTTICEQLNIRSGSTSIYIYWHMYNYNSVDYLFVFVRAVFVALKYEEPYLLL